jgi:GNAT superfamily N-acetyltransferase
MRRSKVFHFDATAESSDVLALHYAERMMDIDITTDLSRVTSQDVQTVYNSVGFEWWMSNPQFNQVFGPGVIGFFAIDRKEGRSVGVLRAFSDEVTVAWICEICIMPSHQRKGIGTQLMNAANQRFANPALYVEPFTHNMEFITKQGLKARPMLVACSRAPLKRDAA